MSTLSPLFTTKHDVTIEPGENVGDVQRKMKLLIWACVFLAVIALGAIGCSVYAVFLKTDFDQLTVKHLVVQPDAQYNEGISIESQGSGFSNGFSGIQITMPNVTTETQHTGVSIQNGYYALAGSSIQGAGIRVDASDVAHAAIQVENGTTGKIIKNGDSNVLT